MTSKRQNQNDISELRGGMIWGIIEKFLIFSLKTRFVYRIIPNIKLNMILYHLKPSSAVKFWSKKRLNSNDFPFDKMAKSKMVLLKACLS